MAAVHAPQITLLMAALDAGLVPAPGAPVRFAQADDGLIVEVAEAAVEGLLAAGLRRVEPPARWTEAASWPALLPLEPTGEPRPPLGEVLFVTRDTGGFLTAAAELIRLGCDQVAICGLSDGRVACRVPEPPYFAVLRALDPTSGLRAFQRQTAGVWTRLGWRHPRMQHITPASQTLLLLDPAGWESLPDGPWTDVHQHLDVEVAAPRRPAPRALDARLQVRLRLVRAPAAAPAELWMITEDAVARLDRLVTTLPDRVVDQLLFAVAGPPDALRVCLRARRGQRPVLDVPGVGYASYLQVPNLLLPEGHAIDPPLRLMRLRTLLAPDPRQLVMLEPGDAPGSFTPVVIDEDAFSPLSDWVDYIVSSAHVALDHWLADARFAFDDFVALDVEWTDGPRTRAASERPANAPTAGRARPRRAERQRRRDQVVVSPPPLPVEALVEAPIAVDDAREAVVAAEAAFCALDLSQSDRALLPHWLELAALQAAAGRSREAALCQAQALSLADPSQLGALAGRYASRLTRTWSDPPTVDEVRGLAVRAIAGAAPATAARRLAEQADALDLRTFWLAQSSLARQEDDRLLLMQTRDHVFDRLKGGMPLAANVPTFIRMHGSKSMAQGTARLGAALGQLMQRYQQTPRERSDIEAAPQLTECYVRLCVAWGHARLGQPEQAAAQRATALRCIPEKKMDGVHGLCIAMYDARIEQALAGRPAGAPLPPEIQTRRMALKRIDRFKADRMRELSRIIDPRRTFDPFEVYQKDEGHPFGEAFARLLARPTAAAIAEGIDAIIEKGGDKGTLLGVIDAMGTLPEALCVPRIRAVLQGNAERAPDEAVEVIEELAVLAAALDRHDLINELLIALRPPAEALAQTDPAELARSLARCAPILRGAGHGEALRSLVKTLEGSLTGNAIAALVARLEFASAKAALGDDSGVRPAFDALFGVLDQISNKHDRFKHVRSLALALGQTTPGTAIGGIDRLWTVLPGVTDDFHTNSHFCLSVVQFMESIVLALASDALSLSEWARRWVEVDEHLLRRRIHRDIA